MYLVPMEANMHAYSEDLLPVYAYTRKPNENNIPLLDNIKTWK